MTFAWKDKALRAAGKRGVAKARAYGLATNRRAPITLAKVHWLERPILPASERELTGKAPTRDHSSVPTRDSGPAQKSQSSVRSPRKRRLNILRPAEPSRAPEHGGRQSPNARSGATWRGLYGRQRGARLASSGLGTVRNPRFIWFAYARVAQGFARTNIRKTVPGESLRRSRLCLRTRLL